MKKLISAFIIFIFITILGGCSNKYNEYNAKIYGKRDQIISDKFLDENHVYKAGYYRINDDGEKEYYYEEDETTPIDRTFIVNDKTTFDSMINEGKLNVDFEKQIVLVYLYFSYFIIICS